MRLLVLLHHWVPIAFLSVTDICMINKIAECIALWGEPEQAVHGMKERTAATSSGMKGKK